MGDLNQSIEWPLKREIVGLTWSILPVGVWALSSGKVPDHLNLVAGGELATKDAFVHGEGLAD